MASGLSKRVFTLRIELGNAAFEIERQHVAEMVRGAANSVDWYNDDRAPLRDGNGNTVGSWQFIEEES